MTNYNEEHSLLLSNGEHIQEVNLDERDNHRGDGHNGCQCHEVLLNSTSEDKKGAEKLLLVLAAFCFAFIIAQFIGGIFAHSIAIVMDSAHMFTDLFSIIISILMLRISRKPPNNTYSYGYLRTEFIGALVSLFIVWMITVIMVIFATQRILSGNIEVEPNIMLVTSIVGIGFNLIMGAFLKCSHRVGIHGHTHSHSHTQRYRHDRSSSNVNIRAAFIHVLGDLMQSIGVLIAAIVIKYTDFHVADSMCTYVFSVAIICTSAPVARDVFRTFMEAIPNEYDYVEIQNTLSQVEGVYRIHNLHIWSLGTDRTASSVHLVIENEARSIQIMNNVTYILQKKYGFHFTTVQTELSQPTLINCSYCFPIS